MPDDSSGNFTLPAGYRAIDGEVAEASQHTPPLEDIAQSMTDRMSRTGKGGMLADLKFGGFKGVNLAQGTDPTDAVTLAQVEALIAASATFIPSGTISSFAGATLPAGWLWADGSLVSRTTYAALFAAIGTTYGNGDGTTTFALPDARGRFPRFAARDGTALDAGRVLGSVQADDTRAHAHTANSVVTDPGHDHAMNLDVVSGAGGGGFPGIGAGTVIRTSANLTGVTVATTIASTGGAETRPANIAFNAIIKT